MTATVPRHLQPDTFVVATLNRWPLNGGTLVDVGCGPGIYRDHVDGTYIGVDQNIHYPDGYPVDIVCDGDNLPFPDGTIDQVMSKCAFFQFPNPEKALREYRRVLRPGGRLFLFDYNRRTQRVLERKENTTHPKWTVFGLGRLVRRSGFTDVALLLPWESQPAGWERYKALLAEELRGQWAIVTAVTPS